MLGTLIACRLRRRLPQSDLSNSRHTLQRRMSQSLGFIFFPLPSRVQGGSEWPDEHPPQSPPLSLVRIFVQAKGDVPWIGAEAECTEDAIPD